MHRPAKLIPLIFIASFMGVLLLIAPLAKATDNPLGKRPLMRFPDVHGDLVVFVYGGDIWKVPAQGGIATRLTIHDGEERFPKFSPDGQWIAFTGEYDGNADVYVMNVYGGDIQRVTFHPGADEVVEWHPLKNKILFQSARKSPTRSGRLFLISPDGTGLEELIFHEAAQGSFSPDGMKFAYNKVSRENRTWKRYKGGTAQEVYLYDFMKNEEKNISQFDGTDRIPMWSGSKIYFSSDRNRVLNIFAYDLKTEKIDQITEHTEYDVRRPSMGGDKIIYERGGTLWLLDTGNRETHQIPVEIRTDLPEARPYLAKVKQFITGFDISPSGKRALIVARGEVFSVPKEHGATRNLTQDCGSRDKDAVWSPDGTKIAYLSDKTGELEIHLVDPEEKDSPVQVTTHESGYRHTLRWSPDSKKIAFADQTLRCYIFDVATKQIIEVDKAYYENVDVSLDKKPISDFDWSPDSRFFAYSKMDEDLVYKIYIFSLETRESHCVSNGLYNDFNPVFSKDGEHLFFVSNKQFNPTFCDFEWEMVYKKIAGVYSLTLKKEGPSLFPYRSDEEGSLPGKKDEQKDSQDVKVVIDFEGIAERVEAFPLKRGNYRNILVNDAMLFYLNAEEGDFNRFEFRKVGPRTLYAFDFKNRKEHVVIENIDGYKLSAGGSQIVYKQGSNIGIIDASARNSKGNPLDLSGMTMWLDPLKEWKQIFHEAWRMERDFYYEPEMHGLDWKAVREKYEKLLPHASCREDIRYIIGEMIGELNTSHTYVYGGDKRRMAEGINVGMLGVDWGIDKDSNRYRFNKIYTEPEWSFHLYPPLSKPGVHIQEGDFIIEVNGQNVTADRNIYEYFQNLAGKQVTLIVNSKPGYIGAKEYVVKPIGDEGLLRYVDWVEHNRKTVEKESNGQIGYIHLPDTYQRSATVFPKYYYSQTRKKGFIIDGRFNGGGLDPDIFLRRFNKKPLAYWTRRYSHDQTTPEWALRAHLVCLTNRQAGSGGDMLPMEFRINGMGPIIGTRSWGGLVGVSMFIEMIDGGGLTAPDYRIYSTEGKWMIENVGVEPDIVIDLHPAEMAKGYDAQLMKGIEVLLKKIKEEPRSWPEREKPPVDR